MKLMFPVPHLMEIGATLQPWELSVSGPDQLRLARLAEELGYDMIAVPEHFAVPANDLHSGAFWLHATTPPAALAGATSRTLLNSGVPLLPLHTPLLPSNALPTPAQF